MTYGFSSHLRFRDSMRRGAPVRRVRLRKSPQRCVKHTERLVQKKFSQEACKRALGHRIHHESSESATSDSPKARQETADEGWRTAIRASGFPLSSPAAPSSSSDAELAPEQFVDRLRVGLAGGSLHHLTDEPADQRRLHSGLLDLVGIAGDNVVDHFLDRRQVGDLFEAARFDDRMRITAFAPADFEQVLGNLARNRARGDQIEYPTKL